MPNYKILVYNSSDELLADISGKHKELYLSYRRNRPDEIRLTYNIDLMRDLCTDIGLTLQQLFATNINYIRIYRGSKLQGAGQFNGKSVNIDGDDRVIELHAVGWFELLKKRFTPTATTTYTGVDAGAIAWDLIDDSQDQTDGDFGITQGALATSISRDRNYSDKNIYDAIVELSEVINGFDFEVTPAKVLNVYYPNIGALRADVVFSYPGNIVRIGFEEDGMSINNQIIARGAGSGENTLHQVATDTVSRGIYKLRQDIHDYNDVLLNATLLEHAQEDVQTEKGLLIIPDITITGNQAPEFGSYGVGDIVLIKINEDLDILDAVEGYKRIEQIECWVDQNEHETVRVRFI